jgi:hypothetical protein
MSECAVAGANTTVGGNRAEDKIEEISGAALEVELRLNVNVRRLNQGLLEERPKTTFRNHQTRLCHKVSRVPLPLSHHGPVPSAVSPIP